MDHLGASLVARARGLYARSVYLPASILGRGLRRLSRRLRGVTRTHEQSTSLSAARWSDLFTASPIRLVEADKRAGNVSAGELAVLATAAAAVPAGTEIVEIGTFDGRTTLNLAINAPCDVGVFTLDLPPDAPTQYALALGERAFVEKEAPGERFRRVGPPWEAAAARIRQLLGDSTTYDWSRHHGRAGLVFVDGSHAHDGVRADSDTALKLVAKKGVVIWHDYGVWDGVTRALEAFEAEHRLGLKHVSGTSLVVLRRE